MRCFSVDIQYHWWIIASIHAILASVVKLVLLLLTQRKLP